MPSWSRRVLIASTAVGLVLTPILSMPPACGEDELIDLANGFLIGVQTQIPGSEFLTVLQNSDLIAISVLKAWLNTKLKEALIDNDAKKEKIVQDLLSRSQDTQAAKEHLHKKQGEDPWSARFNITTPGFALPTSVGQTTSGTAEIDSSDFRIAAWVVPQVWNTVSPQQEPEGSVGFSAMLLPSGDLEIALDAFSFSLPTFPVNVPGHTETGVNVSDYGSGTFVATNEGGGEYSFSFTTLGTLTNDMYDSSNPAIDFAKVEGRMFSGLDGSVTILVGAQDTLLVPAPKDDGEPPIIYAAAQSSFDPLSQSIQFRDPFTGEPGIPIVAVDTFDGAFGSVLNGFGSLPVGATMLIDDLVIQSRSSTEIVFDDASFEVQFDTTTLVTGDFTDVRLNLINGRFLAQTTDVDVLIPDPLLLAFYTHLHEYQFMSPLNALYLYQLSEQFSDQLVAPVLHPHITFVNHNVVPEPGATSLFTIGALIAGRTKRRRGSRQP